MADGEVLYELRSDTSNLDKDLDSAQKKVENASRKIDNGLDKATKSTKKLGDETTSTKKETSKYKEEVDKANKSTKDYEKSTSDASDKMAKMGSVAATAGLAIGGALVATGAYAFSLADDMDKACNGIIAATGESAEETERYKNVVEGIYKNNYGEGFGDIAENIALVKQQMADIDDSELQSVVEKGYLMQDTFGIDITESIRGVKAMMDQFGTSSEEAYNLMTQGAQKGLNQNGDLADQLAEYSVYYADLGYSAEEMFNAVANGTKDGAYQIDYLNDAIKEFGIRSKDGSDASADAFEQLGLNAQKMTTAFAEGGDGAKEAFDLVAEELGKCGDKVLQNQIGVALFGTKFEDLGADAVLALTNTNGAIDATKDKLSEMEDIKYDSVSEMFEGLKRSVETLLLPLGEQLIPIIATLIESLMPVIEQVLPIIVGFIEQLAPYFTQILSEILPPLIEFIVLLVDSVMPIIELIMPTLLLLIQQLLPPVIEFLSMILPPLIEILNVLIEPLLELITALLPPLIQLFDAIIPCINSLMPVIKILAKLFADHLVSSIDTVMPIIQCLIDGFTGLIDFITNIFEGDWKAVWETIVGVFKNTFNTIPTIAEGVINSAIGVINKMIKGFNGLSTVLGIKAIPTIPSVVLPRFKIGIDYVPSDDMPAYLHKGEAVLTASEAEIYRSLGGKGSLERMLSSSVPNVSTATTTQAVEDNSKIINLISTIIAKLEKLGNMTIKMNDKEVGKAVAPYVNKELGNTQTLEERSKF